MCQVLCDVLHMFIHSCMSYTIPALLHSFCRKKGWESEVTNSLPKSTWEEARIYDSKACYTYYAMLPSKNRREKKWTFNGHQIWSRLLLVTRPRFESKFFETRAHALSTVPNQKEIKNGNLGEFSFFFFLRKGDKFPFIFLLVVTD